MRLLNANTLEMKEYYEQIPPYAILSHTWGEEEVTFQDFQSRSDREKKKGFTKITNCCLQAQRDSIEWVWIDTCCIDKTSSAELSEAINSMYAWYRDSHVCYAFLEDVSTGDPEQTQREFAFARWFTRGWCLQELIAPLRIEFYRRDWVEIGTKYSLRHQIQRVTRIPLDVLMYRKLEDHSVAQKMSWASERKTTRIEDQAYCLLGIFGVHMPLLYGEGPAAFRRLQEEIIRYTEDDSIFLWTHPGSRIQPMILLDDMDVLARSTSSFQNQRIELFDMLGDCVKFGSYSDIIPVNRFGQLGLNSIDLWEPPRMTSRGLHVCMPVTTNISAVEKDRITFSAAERTSLQLLWTRCVCQGKLVGILLDESITAGGVKISSRAKIGARRLYLLPLSGCLIDTRLPISQSRVYLRAMSSDWNWAYRGIKWYPRLYPELEVILLPSTENRVKVLWASNETTEKLSFTAETIAEGPRKGQTRLRAAGIAKMFAASRELMENTDIQRLNDCLKAILPASLQRLKMLVLVDEIPIWQCPSASDPLGISLLIHLVDWLDSAFVEPQCKLCFTVSQEDFRDWDGTSDRDQLILPNGLILTAAVKSYRTGVTNRKRYSVHIGLQRPG